MQNPLIALLMAADVFIALIIIALVLVQQSKEGAFGSPFGGVGESVFGAHATGHLTKLTVVFSILFLCITLALAIIIGHRAQPVGIVDRELAITESESKEKKLDTVKTTEKPASEIPASVEKTSEEAKGLSSDGKDLKIPEDSTEEK